MSIYKCQDRIDDLLNGRRWTVAPGALSYFKRILYTFGVKPPPPHPHDVAFLEGLKAELGKIDNMDPQARDAALGSLIIAIMKHQKGGGAGINSFLQYFVDDLTIVKNGKRDDRKEGPQTALSDQYEKLLKSSLLLKPIRQGGMQELGHSRGECYGFTMSMVDSRLSPYNASKDIVFNRTVHDYQKNQNDRQEDQKRIKRTRLTRLNFCPSLQEQAERLYQTAFEHRGQDLKLTLQGRAGLHATYLSMQDNGDVRYADPNHGAFLFKNKEQFVSAYRLIYTAQSQKNPEFDFHFFDVSTLDEDANLTKQESKSVSGKWRSLLTGTKYDEKASVFIEIISVVLYSCIGALTGGAMGATIGSVILIVGTSVGFAIGLILGALVGELIVLKANDINYRGLMGGYHYCREVLHNEIELIKEICGIERECDVLPPSVIPDAVAGSTATVMAQLDVNPEPPAAQPTDGQVSNLLFSPEMKPTGAAEVRTAEGAVCHDKDNPGIARTNPPSLLSGSNLTR